MKSILLLDGEGTQALPIARSLAQTGYRVHATFGSKLNYGYFSRYISGRHLFPHDGALYLDALVNLLRTVKFDAVIPLSDKSAELLSRYQSVLKPYTHYVMPEYTSFDGGYNKDKLMDL